MCDAFDCHIERHCNPTRATLQYLFLPSLFAAIAEIAIAFI